LALLALNALNSSDVKFTVVEELRECAGQPLLLIQLSLSMRAFLELFVWRREDVEAKARKTPAGGTPSLPEEATTAPLLLILLLLLLF